MRLPFREFQAVFRARTLRDAAPVDPSRIVSFQVRYLCLPSA